MVSVNLEAKKTVDVMIEKADALRCYCFRLWCKCRWKF